MRRRTPIDEQPASVTGQAQNPKGSLTAPLEYPDETYISYAEAERRFHIKIRTLRNYQHMGKIPVVRLRGSNGREECHVSTTALEQMGWKDSGPLATDLDLVLLSDDLRRIVNSIDGLKGDFQALRDEIEKEFRAGLDARDDEIRGLRRELDAERSRDRWVYCPGASAIPEPAPGAPTP